MIIHSLSGIILAFALYKSCCYIIYILSYLSPMVKGKIGGGIHLYSACLSWGVFYFMTHLN